MLVKNISGTIRKKINDWLSSVEDEKLRKDLKNNVIVTGGCIPSLLENNKVNDYDVYFRTKDITKRVAEYYVQKFKEKPLLKTDKDRLPDITVEESAEGRIKIKVASEGIAGIEPQEDEGEDVYNEEEEWDAVPSTLDQVQNEEPVDYVQKATGVQKKDISDEDKEEVIRYRPIFLSSNAITLTNKVQLIVRFYGEPEEIHKNYDFVHCTNYWTSWKKTRDSSRLVLNKDALASIITKELRYVGSRYPLCSIIRTRKFIKRGYVINVGQYLKMVMQLQELDLFNISVLEDQLCGVDVAYFQHLIDDMKAYVKNSENPDRVDTLYLMETIDKVF